MVLEVKYLFKIVFLEAMKINFTLKNHVVIENTKIIGKIIKMERI